MILDRDDLPDDAIPRPGVPQGKHPHGLLGGGVKALENLFPGFGNELMRAGAERSILVSTFSVRSLVRMFGRELTSTGGLIPCPGR